MSEDFVTYELAVKLKEKGFPQRPDYFNYSSYYDWDGLRKIHSLSNASVWFDPNINRESIYFAPTISQVLKWLRKEKGLHIEILHFFSEKTLWDFEVAHIGSYERWWNNLELFDTYELAVLAGIEYCLDNLV